MSTNWAPISSVPTDGRDVQVAFYPGSRQLVASWSAGAGGLVVYKEDLPILPTHWRDLPDTFALPTISSISPTSASKASGNFTLTVNGTGFTSDAVVYLNGAALTTTYVSATQVTAAVVVAALSPGAFTVTVRNGSNAASNEKTFTLTA